MGEGYTLMIVRDDGRASRNLQVSARSVLGALCLGAGIAALCLFAGWQLGILTAAL